MPAWVLRPPRVLWQVTQAAVVTNERVAGIVGENPVTLNPYFRAAIFYVVTTQQTTLTIAAIRVYGAFQNIGGGLAATPRFPAAGTTAEALWSTLSNVPLNTSKIRQPTILNADGGQNNAAPLLPNVLLLEYSTAGVGAGLEFQVWGCFAGPLITGQE